ncbi:MAG TPA: PAS domain-containing sensor histidine kinase [Candidatus Paceibacterota bacterium]|nr:PAS domain-containing sensor histidine kinase [Verrucomicrobiota bacterium]HRY50191.1 PAS domain-containing sensor histidine kinase [Candidatus Paceibacterota bacterium]HSA01306.1 PAS domain-containing sensor histidine kinase [Candidatus Paceibacterota bacterium]
MPNKLDKLKKQGTGRLLALPVMRKWICVLLLRCVFVSMGIVLPSSPAAAAASTIHQARQVLSLSSQEASAGLPVTLKGVVTCYDTDWNLCFLQDSTAGVYLWRVLPEMGLYDGAWIEVKGVSGTGQYSPIVVVSNAVVLGQRSKPAARTVGLQDLSSGGLDSQWVEITGVVHEDRTFADRWSLDLYCGGEKVVASVLTNKPTNPTTYRDAKLKLRGVAAAIVNDRSQFTGYQLIVPSLSDVTVIRPPPDDPFAMPVSGGRSLFAYSSQSSWEHQVHVQGVVTLHIPGQALYLRDYSGGYRIQTSRTEPLQPRTRVDVVGFASRNHASPQITDAIIRELGMGRSLTPYTAEYTQATNGLLDCEYIQIEAELINSQQSRDGYHTLYLKAHQGLFQAHLLPHLPANSPPPWTPGSLLQLRGVCELSADRNTTSPFSLWIGSLSDIEVLKQPAGAFGRRLGVFLGAILVILLIVLGWILLLRRQVASQTATLRRREAMLEDRYRDLFENAHDIIFTHDLDGRLTSMNHAGALALGLPQDKLQGLSFFDLITSPGRQKYCSHIDPQVSDDNRFCSELELKTDRHKRLIWEVNTRIDYQDGKPVGIRGIAHDVTQKRESQEALLHSERELRHSLEQQQRIAQDLHDDIIQSIYAIGLGLENCRQRLGDGLDGTEKRLKHCLSELNRVIRKVRSFIGDMNADTPNASGFVTEMHSLLQLLGEDDRSKVDLQIDPLAVARLTPRQMPQLLQITRESLSNSLRHSHSTHIQLSLQASDGRIRLEIHDNGLGFDPSIAVQKGNGLRNITARACQLGANLSIESHPGGGTRIALELPPNKTLYASN